MIFAGIEGLYFGSFDPFLNIFDFGSESFSYASWIIIFASGFYFYFSFSSFFSFSFSIDLLLYSFFLTKSSFTSSIRTFDLVTTSLVKNLKSSG